MSDSMYIYVSFFQTFVSYETCFDMYLCFYFLVMLSANYCADPFINSTQLSTIFLLVSVGGVAIALAINMHLIIPLKTYSIYQKQT